MAWQVIEQAKDAVISVSREADMSTCVRTFLVYEDNPAYVLPANGTFEIYLQIRNATVAPFNVIQKVGTRLVPGATDFLRAQFVVSDLQISPHPDRANTFVVKQTSKAPLIAGQAYRGVKVTEQTRNRTVQAYMLPASFPTYGDVNPWDTNAFIGGVVYNISGNPFPFEIPQRIMTVEFPVHLPASDVGYTAGTVMPDFGQYINYRNDGDWLGVVGTAGKWLFAAAERRQLTEQVNMFVHTFVFDPWYHLDQVPVRQLNGELTLDTSFNLGNPAIAQRGTSKVIWRQPYAGKVAFDGAYKVLPPGIEAIVDLPSPAWN